MNPTSAEPRTLLTSALLIGAGYLTYWADQTMQSAAGGLDWLGRALPALGFALTGSRSFALLFTFLAFSLLLTGLAAGLLRWYQRRVLQPQEMRRFVRKVKLERAARSQYQRSRVASLC